MDREIRQRRQRRNRREPDSGNFPIDKRLLYSICWQSGLISRDKDKITATYRCSGLATDKNYKDYKIYNTLLKIY